MQQKKLIFSKYRCDVAIFKGMRIIVLVFLLSPHRWFKKAKTPLYQKRGFYSIFDISLKISFVSNYKRLIRKIQAVNHHLGSLGKNSIVEFVNIQRNANNGIGVFIGVFRLNN